MSFFGTPSYFIPKMSASLSSPYSRPFWKESENEKLSQIERQPRLDYGTVIKDANLEFRHT